MVIYLFEVLLESTFKGVWCGGGSVVFYFILEKSEI